MGRNDRRWDITSLLRVHLMKKSLPLSTASLTVVLLMLAISALAEGPPPAAQGKGADAKTRRQVSTQIIEKTLVAAINPGPKPWPNGNCFWLSPLTPEQRRERAKLGADPFRLERLHVVNMHAENFEEIGR